MLGYFKKGLQAAVSIEKGYYSLAQAQQLVILNLKFYNNLNKHFEKK